MKSLVLLYKESKFFIEVSAKNKEKVSIITKNT